MTKPEFTAIINSSEKLSSYELDNLEELAISFPYCQIAHVLIARISNQQATMFAKQKLGKAAAYILDRKKLKVLVKETSSWNNNALAKSQVTPVKKMISEQLPANDLNVTSNQNPVQSEKVARAASLVNPSESIKPLKLITESDSLTLPGDTNADNRRSVFFEELDKNLRHLSDLRNQRDPAAKLPSESAPPIATSGEVIIPQHHTAIPEEVSAATPVKEENLTQFFREEFAEQSDETAEFPIRLEDVDIKDQQKNDKQASQLYLKYLEFLAARKSREENEKVNTNTIIEKFIEEEPSIPSLKNIAEPSVIEDLSEKSTQISNGLVSENFANILIRQKKYLKAIEMYEQLMIRNPEKKSYFAEKIEQLRTNL